MAATNQKARDRAEARRREIAERQRQEARRRLLLRIFLPIALVVVVVAVFVVVKVTSGGDDSRVIASGPAPASVVSAVTSIPAATFDAVGAGSDVKAPTPVDGSALTSDGKPRVLYVGGEFCPFCAAERWVVVASLARFGTFTNLAQTNSASDDVYPDTATLSFHGASYVSDYLVFDGYETTDREHKPLDTLPSSDEALLQSLDPDGSIPFQDLGGKFVQSGSSYVPTVLKGKTHAEIASAIKDPDTDIGKAVLAAANLYTARLCQLTDGQPGAVCTSSGVTAAASSLGS
ncbi:DUF929 family protein [Jatrophihabitans sp. YIM 134969]